MSERVWTPAMVEELVRLRRAGASFGKISKRLGVRRGAAIETALRIGLRVRIALRRPAVKAEDEPAAIGPIRDIVGLGVCHWIAGDTGSAWRMCGHKSVPGSVWCAHHAARVYVRVREISAKRKDAA